MKLLKIEEINFPVYLIKSYKDIWEEFNVLYINTGKTTKILDNKNLPGKTIGIRRLYIDNKILYKLKTISGVKYLIKYGNHIFIDNKGFIFKYNKTKFVPLVYKKILYIEKRDGVGLILRIKDIDKPIVYSVTFFNPFAEYARILVTPIGPIVYDLTIHRGKNTKIKI